MSCQDCSKFCLCSCGTIETRTEIILYPVNHPRKNFRDPRKKSKNTSLGQELSKMQSISRSTKITDSNESLSKNGLMSSQFCLSKSSQFCSSKSSQFCSSKSKLGQGEEPELNIIREINSQNKQNASENSQNGDNKTKKNVQLNIGRGSVAFVSHRSLMSPVSTMRNSHITVRLLERENNQLKDELDKLKKQEKQLFEFQQLTRAKNNRQIGILKQKCDDIERRSISRQGQLIELKNLLSIAKAHRKSAHKNSISSSMKVQRK